MPINTTHSSAGVYTAVKDLSVGAVSLSSAVVGMVGGARRGPVNQIVPVRNTDYLKNIFGQKDPRYGLGLYVAEPIAKQTNELFYVRLVNGAKYSVVVMTVDDPSAKQPRIRLTNYTNEAGEPVGVNSPSQLGFLPDDPLNNNLIGYFLCENPGNWNNTMALQLRSYAPRGLDPYNDRLSYNNKLFYIDEFENYEGGSQPVNSYACCLNLYQDDLNRQYEIESVLDTESDNFRFKKNPYFVQNNDPSFFGSDFCYCQGGSDGAKLTSDMIAKGYTDFFSDPEEVRVTLLVSGGFEDHIVHRAMQMAASQHINCHVVASPPRSEQTVNRYIRYRRQTLNLNVRNMSLYAPDVRLFDADTARYLEVPCSGEVAAVYCYTDNNRGSWFAPAGIDNSEVLNIVGITQKYDQDDRDAMTREQLNYIRKLPAEIGGGFAVWEASTLLNSASAFQQIQIQRMVGYVLEVTSRSARTGLFDPNDQVLREYLQSMVEKFLEEIKLARGLRGGESGSEGYKVVCNETNNTPATIANGDLILDIILDPTRMTKRIIYRFNINPKGSRSTTL